MRTSERHRLKENEFAIALAQAGDYYNRHRKTITAVLVLLVLVAVAIAGFTVWRRSVESNARQSLAQAMVVSESRVMAAVPGADPAAPPAQQPGTFPTERAKLEAALPKFLATADTYPSTDAGRTARYHAAATLVALGRYGEAVQQYDQVSGGSSLVAQGARLGKAEAQLLAGQHDAAITAFKEISDKADGNLPKEALLLELARAYKVAGKHNEARQTLSQIVEQHADSPFANTAKQELEKIPG